ncbi:MAG: metallophosphoesterase [Erysipelotrichaceae bacterium]|nr:metallophosphoesterase [Erysipelotrichaceae bacterium]
MWVALLIISVVIIILLIIKTIIDTKKILTIHYRLEDGNLYKIDSCDSIDKEIKIVFFSDLHIGKLLKKEELAKQVIKLKQLNGDIYLFGGDLIGSKTNKYYDEKILSKCFEPLKNKSCYAIYGNHEYKIERNITINEKHNLFNAMGFKVLDNDSVIFKKDGLSLSIYGMNDTLYNHAVLPLKKYDLILSHEGDVVDNISSQVILSGHTHGGQIKLPFIPLYYRPKYGRKYTYGLHEKNQSKLLVTSGLGFGKLRLRLFARREIVVIHFTKNER